jgi:hypothetical protein
MLRLRSFSLALLVVLVVLAGGSSAFADAAVTLTPSAGCPGKDVSVSPPCSHILTSGPSMLTSGFSLCPPPNPRGLFCGFTVSQSASPGEYSVTCDYEGGSDTVPFTVDPSLCPPPVGGCLQPVNTFAVLAPWLAVIGLVGCIGVVGVVVKRRLA